MTHIQHRLDEVRRLLEKRDLPALLITQAENRRYLSGFTGSAGTLLITPQHAFLSTDFRYWEQAAHQAPYFTMYPVKGRVSDSWPGFIAAAGNPTRIGFESGAVTVAQYAELQKALPEVEWVSTTALIENVRAVKDEDELVLTQKAIGVAEMGLEHLLSVLQPGMTEKQAAWELEVYLRTYGADGLSFETIIASGPNGAMGHHHPDERVIQSDEPIVIDWGAEIGGYRSDLTRTIVLGEPDAKFREVYDIVLKAQINAVQHIRAGMTGAEADALARDVIVAAGYGEQFGHGLGHGVGLAVHELPRASHLADDELLPASAILTVEPGIYIPGWGGVRIEDMVLVKEGGVEVLSHFKK